MAVQQLSFRDRWVVVTGAARGIGRATAELLATRGARLVLADVDRDAVDEAARMLRARDATVLSYGVDVASREAMREFADWVYDHVDSLELLVNNAGVLEVGGLFDTSWEAWEHVVGVNLWGVIHGCRYFAPEMRERQRGHIVNVASVAGLVGFSSLLAYTTTKFGVVGFSQALRAELEPCGVGVSVVCPGLVNTSIVEQDRFDKELREKMRGVLEQRGMDPSRVARAVIDAAERNQAYVTVGARASALEWMGRAMPGVASRVLERAASSRFFGGK